MGPDEHLDATRDQVDLIVAALEATALDDEVPSCPGWTVGDLVDHVGGFCGFWTHVLCEGTGADKPDFPPLEGDTAAWFRATGDLMLAVLEATPADTVVWTWVPDQQHTTFVRRRITHELAIHRIDAQLAAGSPTPLDAIVADDNVREILVMIPHVPSGPPDAGTDHTLALQPTDLDHDLVITLAAGGPALAADGGDAADLRLAGTMSDLALLLNGRPEQGEVRRDGDGSVYDEWREVFRFGG